MINTTVIESDGTSNFKEKASKAFRLSVFDLYQKIIKKTPVDTGQARSNWLINYKQTESKHDYYIYNGLPYMASLEYGLYKKAKKKANIGSVDGVTIAGKTTYITSGSRRRNSGPRTTALGYSTQAPTGIVRVSAIEAELNLKSRIISLMESL